MRDFSVKEVYLTSRTRFDGAGSQILAMLSNICFAEFTQLTYAHTPFIRMSHAPGGLTEEECATMWERHLRLGESAVQASELHDVRKKWVRGPQFIDCRQGTLYEVDNSHTFMDRYPQLWAETVNRIKEQRWPKRRSRIGDVMTVAAHARRGDVPESESMRYTNNDQLYRSLSAIKDCVSTVGLIPEFNVYSEGKEDDFSTLKDLNIKLHLNGDQISDWEALRSADIILVSRSAYSFSAALLSDGIVLCPRFWHEPLPGWIRLSESGSFCCDDFQKGLQLFLSRGDSMASGN